MSNAKSKLNVHLDRHLVYRHSVQITEFSTDFSLSPRKRIAFIFIFEDEITI